MITRYEHGKPRCCVSPRHGLVTKDRAVVPEKLEEGGLAAVDREDGEQKRGLLQRGLSTREASRECWLSVPLWGGG